MRLRFRTYEFDETDVHVRTLRDNQEYDDPRNEAGLLGISSANWSLFGVVWDSSLVLARMMWARGFHGERILEVGCGIGLASLVLALRDQDISATDRHPEAHGFLNYNAMLNGLPPLKFERCSWAQPGSLLGKFDLIIGSDLLYDHSSLEPLALFIAQHAKSRCNVLIVDPNRGLRSRFSRHMQSLGYESSPRSRVTQHGPDGYEGSVLEFRRLPTR